MTLMRNAIALLVFAAMVTPAMALTRDEVLIQTRAADALGDALGTATDAAQTRVDTMQRRLRELGLETAFAQARIVAPAEKKQIGYRELFTAIVDQVQA